MDSFGIIDWSEGDDIISRILKKKQLWPTWRHKITWEKKTKDLFGTVLESNF